MGKVLSTVGFVCRRLELLLGLPAQRDAAVAGHALIPRVAQDLHAQTLMVGVVAGEVAVGLEANSGVVASKKKLFPVAHPGLYGRFVYLSISSRQWCLVLMAVSTESG